jgi:hypothetical protein
MKTPNERRKFIETLEECPFLTIAAKRVGIDKSTIYRWKNKNKKFHDKMNESLEKGRELMVDVVEGVTFSEAKKGNMQACRMILENNSKRYYRPKAVLHFDSLADTVDGIDITIHHTNKSPVGQKEVKGS